MNKKQIRLMIIMAVLFLLHIIYLMNVDALIDNYTTYEELHDNWSFYNSILTVIFIVFPILVHKINKKIKAIGGIRWLLVVERIITVTGCIFVELWNFGCWLMYHQV